MVGVPLPQVAIPAFVADLGSEKSASPYTPADDNGGSYYSPISLTPTPATPACSRSNSPTLANSDLQVIVYHGNISKSGGKEQAVVDSHTVLPVKEAKTITDLPRELRDEILHQVALDSRHRLIIGSSITSNTSFIAQLPPIAYVSLQLYWDYLPIFLTTSHFVFMTIRDIYNFIRAIDSLPIEICAPNLLNLMEFHVHTIGAHTQDLWGPAFFAPSIKEIKLVFNLESLNHPYRRTALHIIDEYRLESLFWLLCLNKVVLSCKWPQSGPYIPSRSPLDMIGFWDLSEYLADGFRAVWNVARVELSELEDDPRVGGMFELRIGRHADN